MHSPNFRNRRLFGEKLKNFASTSDYERLNTNIDKSLSVFGDISDKSVVNDDCQTDCEANQFSCPVAHCSFSYNNLSNAPISRQYLARHFILTHSKYHYAECRNCYLAFVSRNENKLKLDLVSHFLLHSKNQALTQLPCSETQANYSLSDVNNLFNIGFNEKPIVPPEGGNLFIEELFSFNTDNWNQFVR